MIHTYVSEQRRGVWVVPDGVEVLALQFAGMSPFQVDVASGRELHWRDSSVNLDGANFRTLRPRDAELEAALHGTSHPCAHVAIAYRVGGAHPRSWDEIGTLLARVDELRHTVANCDHAFTYDVPAFGAEDGYWVERRERCCHKCGLRQVSTRYRPTDLESWTEKNRG